MLIKNKKGQLAQIGDNIIAWLLATFTYFTFGYDMLQVIIEDSFLANNPAGVMYALGLFIPFIPILGLMLWGYFILNTNNSGGGIPE